MLFYKELTLFFLLLPKINQHQRLVVHIECYNLANEKEQALLKSVALICALHLAGMSFVCDSPAALFPAHTSDTRKDSQLG